MLFQSLDHLIIAVADLDAATAGYRTLLGRAPSWRGEHPTHGTRNTVFRLENTYVELLAADRGARSPFGAMVREALGDRAEQPFGLAIGVSDVTAAVNAARSRGLRASDPAPGEGTDQRSGRRRLWRNAMVDSMTSGGLRLLLIQHLSPAQLLPRAMHVAADASLCIGVDHVVVFTCDLNASLRLWTDVLRLSQSWRQEFPERGTTNVGIALGDVTVELVMRTERAFTGAPDRFWGVAYQVADCARAAARLRAAGLEVDDPRPGLAPDTRVTTVRRTGTQTLLLERLTTRV